MKIWIIKISIWIVGFTVIYFINAPEADFIQENGIVTWNAVRFWIIFIICYGISSKNPFWENLSKDSVENCKNKIQNSETRIENLENANEKIINFITKEFEESEETKDNFQLEIKNLKNALKTLSSQLLEHTADCSDLYECQSCWRLHNGERLVLDGNDQCDHCQEVTYFNKATISLHNQPDPKTF